MMLPHQNPVIHKLGKSILKKSIRNEDQNQSYLSSISSSQNMHNNNYNCAYNCNPDKQNEGIHEQKLRNITKSIQNENQSIPEKKRNRYRSTSVNVSSHWITQEQVEQLKVNNESLKRKIKEREDSIKQMNDKVVKMEAKYGQLVKNQNKRLMSRVSSINQSIIYGQKSFLQGQISRRGEGKQNLSRIKEKLSKMNVQNINKKE